MGMSYRRAFWLIPILLFMAGCAMQTAPTGQPAATGLSANLRSVLQGDDSQGYITYVRPGSLAQDMGIRVGDRVLGKIRKSIGEMDKARLDDRQRRQLEKVKRYRTFHLWHIRTTQGAAYYALPRRGRDAGIGYYKVGSLKKILKGRTPILIKKVTEGSFAAKNGITPGDAIIAFFKKHLPIHIELSISDDSDNRAVFLLFDRETNTIRQYATTNYMRELGIEQVAKGRPLEL